MKAGERFGFRQVVLVGDGGLSMVVSLASRMRKQIKLYSPLSMKLHNEK